MKRVGDDAGALAEEGFGISRYEGARGGNGRSLPPKSFLGALYKALVYLDQLTSFGPGIGKMAKDDAQAYVIGYAAPLLEVGVDPQDLMPAAVKYLAKYPEFPKPARLIEFVAIARQERETAELVNAPALPAQCEGPPVSEETRRAVRLRLGLDE